MDGGIPVQNSYIVIGRTQHLLGASPPSGFGTLPLSRCQPSSWHLNPSRVNKFATEALELLTILEAELKDNGLTQSQVEDELLQGQMFGRALLAAAAGDGDAPKQVDIEATKTAEGTGLPMTTDTQQPRPFSHLPLKD